MTRAERRAVKRAADHLEATRQRVPYLDAQNGSVVSVRSYERELAIRSHQLAMLRTGRTFPATVAELLDAIR